ncbi:Prolipoprotein diacylglyceryltransferase [Cnuella takakiae]|uniref:Prolipoprotein diacylglyceryltransferase n=1 Tax=Cnuella takakiae TaxID=1302690 RepID=A0A1M5DCK9_9BACT|nr:prolipoprotein diacylglyceryl transferase family protein [Cnuella takakiae]OLY94019.1 hypothetical protein BUE76_20610 [Cnuella takakiae]SHF64697.1 Prolipoprotein diacylglyceryltransferase [Cnuella takakiae]
MSFPFSVHIGSLQLPLHGIFELLAYSGGFRYYLYLRNKQGDVFDTQTRMVLLAAAIFGALAGSRIIGILERPGEWQEVSNFWIYLFSNKTILGGLLGGLAGVELVKWRLHEQRSSGDLLVYPLLLGMIIGRIGCFTMGVYEPAYGLLTNTIWGMNLGDGINRHPVTLYEIFFLLMLWGALQQTQKRLPLAPGALFKLFMIAYLFFRFFIEYFKPHYPYPYVGLSAIQLTAIMGLVYYLPYLYHPRKLLLPAYART